MKNCYSKENLPTVTETVNKFPSDKFYRVNFFVYSPPETDIR